MLKQQHAPLPLPHILAYEGYDPDETTKGPSELIVLRPPSDTDRRKTLAHGLKYGLERGCQAALLIEIKAAVEYDNFWQALAAGIQLARWNARRDAGQVHVVLKDARTWYFFSLQCVSRQQPGDQQEATAAVGGRRGGDAHSQCGSSWSRQHGWVGRSEGSWQH